MSEKFNVDLYIRVSTERQAKEGDSLDEQENELRKYCDYRGYAIHRVYIERGKSGGNTNRPEYQKLIKDIESQKINAVVVKKLDRLSRSLLDFEQLIGILQKNNVEFISLKENFDTTTAMGKAMLRVALVFAQLEREQTSERIIDVFAYRAEQGLFNGGVPPYGYVSANKELVPHQKEKKIIEIVFNKFIETESTIQTAKFLNDTGYRDRRNKCFDCRRILWMLQKPVYTGKLQWKDCVYQGIHPPIISDNKFNQVQEIFNKQKYRSERSGINAVLQKILFCGYCKCPMSPSHSLNKYRNKYYYYRCTSTKNLGKPMQKCQFKYVSFKEADKRVVDILLSISQEEQFKLIENRILKHNQGIERAEQQIKKAIALLDQDLEEIKEKKEKYLDSLISSKFLSSERKRIDEKIAELELEEKQIKSTMYKQQFEHDEKEDEKIDLVAYKKSLIVFRAEHDRYSAEELRKYLSATIQDIYYYPEKLSIKFRLLPWRVDFDNNCNCEIP